MSVLCCWFILLLFILTYDIHNKRDGSNDKPDKIDAYILIQNLYFSPPLFDAFGLFSYIDGDIPLCSFLLAFGL